MCFPQPGDMAWAALKGENAIAVPPPPRSVINNKVSEEIDGVSGGTDSSSRLLFIITYFGFTFPVSHH